jgi:hypothetical protein
VRTRRSRNRHLNQLLAQANPAGFSDMDDAETSARSALTLQRILAEPQETTRRPTPREGHRRWAFSGVAVAAAVGVALLLPVVMPDQQGVGPQDGPGRSAPPTSRAFGWPGGVAPTSAGEALESMALVANHQLASETGGRYLYTQSESLDGVTIAGAVSAQALVPTTREIWIARDGSGRLRRRSGKPVFLSEGDRRQWEAATRDLQGFQGGGVEDDTFGPGGLSFRDLSGYPTDPDALFQAIQAEARGFPVPEQEMFVIVGDLLRETDASPEFRSALYRVAARIPGVELVGEVVDPSGRHGAAVGFRSGHWRKELIFDPSTSLLLAERTVLIEPDESVDKPPGTVTTYAVYLKSGYTDSTSTEPE